MIPGVWIRASVRTAAAALLLSAGTASGQPLPGKLARWLGPQEWVKQRNKPVVSLGKSGDFDDMHIFAPYVARDAGKYFMWYPGSGGAVADRVFRLGLATSSDGVEFAKAPNSPVWEFGDPKISVVTVSVLRDTDGSLIREDGKLRMWFTGVDLTIRPSPHSLHHVFGSAPDKWEKPSAVLMKNCYAPTVIKDGDRYRMWYTDVAPDRWVLRHAQSRDGFEWQVTETPVLTVDSRWEDRLLVYPHVVNADGVYLMWYSSYWWWNAEDGPRKTAIGFAVSEDGIVWHKHPQNPVLRPDPALPWESHFNSSESVVRLADGSWRIYYGCRKEPPWVNKYFALSTAAWTGPH